ncbi:MAG: hypothetical protein V3U59_04315, partial [Gammaproteobacteria bacterium]
MTRTPGAVLVLITVVVVATVWLAIQERAADEPEYPRVQEPTRGRTRGNAYEHPDSATDRPSTHLLPIVRERTRADIDELVRPEIEEREVQNYKELTELLMPLANKGDMEAQYELAQVLIN